MSSNSKIRIGVDITSLSKRRSGIGRYSEELLKRLLIDMTDVEWFLYSAGPVESPITEFPNIVGKNFARRIKFTGWLWVQLILPWLLRRDRVQIFWSLSPRPPILLASFIKRVVTVHDFVWKRFPKTMTLRGLVLDFFLGPIAIKKADHIFCVSSATFNDLARFYPGTELKASVTPLAGSLKVLGAGLRQSERLVEGNYFLFVGTLEPRKNLKRLIEAFSQVLVSPPKDIKLVIAGSVGWGHVDIESIAQRFGIDHKVIYKGNVSDNELTELYKHSLFLAFPSLYEGFGLPIIEALTIGIPVLTSNRSCMPEVVGEAGILVDPEDIMDITRGLQAMISDEKLREKLRYNCKREASRYSWEITSELSARGLRSLVAR